MEEMDEWMDDGRRMDGQRKKVERKEGRRGGRVGEEKKGWIDVCMGGIR